MKKCEYLKESRRWSSKTPSPNQDKLEGMDKKFTFDRGWFLMTLKNYTRYSWRELVTMKLQLGLYSSIDTPYASRAHETPNS